MGWGYILLEYQLETTTENGISIGTGVSGTSFKMGSIPSITPSNGADVELITLTADYKLTGTLGIFTRAYDSKYDIEISNSKGDGPSSYVYTFPWVLGSFAVGARWAMTQGDSIANRSNLNYPYGIFDWSQSKMQGCTVSQLSTYPGSLTIINSSFEDSVLTFSAYIKSLDASNVSMLNSTLTFSGFIDTDVSIANTFINNSSLNLLTFITKNSGRDGISFNGASIVNSLFSYAPFFGISLSSENVNLFGSTVFFTESYFPCMFTPPGAKCNVILDGLHLHTSTASISSNLFTPSYTPNDFLIDLSESNLKESAININSNQFEFSGNKSIIISVCKAFIENSSIYVQNSVFDSTTSNGSISFLIGDRNFPTLGNYLQDSSFIVDSLIDAATFDSSIISISGSYWQDSSLNLTGLTLDNNSSLSINSKFFNSIIDYSNGNFDGCAETYEDSIFNNSSINASTGTRSGTFEFISSYLDNLLYNLSGITTLDTFTIEESKMLNVNITSRSTTLTATAGILSSTFENLAFLLNDTLGATSRFYSDCRICSPGRPIELTATAANYEIKNFTCDKDNSLIQVYIGGFTGATGGTATTGYYSPDNFVALEVVPGGTMNFNSPGTGSIKFSYASGGTFLTAAETTFNVTSIGSTNTSPFIQTSIPDEIHVYSDSGVGGSLLNILIKGRIL